MAIGYSDAVRWHTQRSRTVRRLHTCAAALAALALALVGPRVAHAEPGGVGVADQPIPPTCTWRNVSSVSRGNRAFMEGNATSWTTYYYAYQAVLLHITGQFPFARYMGFIVQPVSQNDDGTYTINQTVGDHLYDVAIKPAKGSTNPFVAGANRTATRRSYDAWVRFQPPTGTAHGNVLYGGASGLGALTYRVYAPDKGRNAQGGVPLPTIDKVVLQGGGAKPIRIHVPPCAGPAPLRATALQQQISATLTHAPDLTWRHSLSSPAFAYSSLSLNTYLGFDQLATPFTRGKDLLVVRFKAPSFAGTYTGAALTGREQVRYWSLCEYELSSGQEDGCVPDYQANRDKQGYATIVLGAPNRRPAGAGLAAANWLPFGRDRRGVLIYRQLLASSAFTQSIQRAPDSAAGMRSSMGPYYPTLVSCTSARWRDDRCATGR